MSVVVVDAPAGAALRVCGMPAVERVVRDAVRGGASRVVVRGDAAALPALPALPATVEVAPAGAPAPDGATVVPGDVIAGVRVHDAASRRAAERALLQTCRRPYDGIGDKYVIRAFSLRATGVLAKLGVTPNQVTFANIGVGLAACVLAMRGGTTDFLLAGVLMFLQVVLDSSDGELARIRYMHSRFGMFLDNGSDDVIDNLFIAALGIGIGGPWLVVGVVAASLRMCVALGIYVAVARMGKPGDVLAFRWWFDKADDQLVERFEHKLTPLAVVRSLGRRDAYCLVWTATCVTGVPGVGLGLGVAVATSYVVLAIGHLAAKRRG